MIQDGVHTLTKPQAVREVVSPKTARLVTGMLVEVVEKGHGKKAGVPGYYVAGKTGTAQIPDHKHGGYMPPEYTIGSFAGYAPADHPKFAMLIRIDHPRNVAFAESSAAPTFGEIAQFLLSYFHVEPTRPILKPQAVPQQDPTLLPAAPLVPSVPVSATSTDTPLPNVK